MAMRPSPVLSLPTALNACRIDVGGGEVKTSPATPALSMPGPTKPANNNRHSSNLMRYKRIMGRVF